MPHREALTPRWDGRKTWRQGGGQVCYIIKPATSKLSVLVRSVKGTGSAAARAAAAGEAGEPSDGGRSCIGASAVGAVGGGIHRCGSLRANDCGSIVGGRCSAGTFYVKERT